MLIQVLHVTEALYMYAISRSLLMRFTQVLVHLSCASTVIASPWQPSDELQTVMDVDAIAIDNNSDANAELLADLRKEMRMTIFKANSVSSWIVAELQHIPSEAMDEINPAILEEVASQIEPIINAYQDPANGAPHFGDTAGGKRAKRVIDSLYKKLTDTPRGGEYIKVAVAAVSNRVTESTLTMLEARKQEIEAATAGQL